MDEEIKENYIKSDALNIIWNFLKLHYLRKTFKNESKITRIFINLNLKYITKQFKINRLLFYV